MALINSISGIRGTIGGRPGEGLSPVDIVNFASTYGMWLKSKTPEGPLCAVIGRDSRISGSIVSSLVVSTLRSMGIDIIDAGLSTTPTIEISVIDMSAEGGIIITASHNPRNWNALKLLNEKGEFLTSEEVCEMQKFSDPADFVFVSSEKTGTYTEKDDLLDRHIEKILELPLVDIEAIRAANFSIVVDGINSSGGIAVPQLLSALGVKKIREVYCEPDGIFQHNPEPLPENLTHLSSEVGKSDASLGIAVDPDVDRLAIISEDGDAFGEEYTLVAVADYVLSQGKGNTVSNLSSTQALAEVTEKYGGKHYYSAVGEVNVVEAMKAHKAVIGGEGNGGVIYPELHYGRDALVGIALFLSKLAISGLSCSRLRKTYPDYYISKNKIELSRDVDTRQIIDMIAGKYSKQQLDRTDGLKIWFDREWVHLRASNTEPVIRIYAESDGTVKADHIAEKIKVDISEILKGY